MKIILSILLLSATSLAETSKDIAAEQAQKKVIVGDLKNKAFSFEKEHGQTVPQVQQIEEFCMSENTSVSDCKLKTSKALNKLQTKDKLLGNAEQKNQALTRFNEKAERREKFKEKIKSHGRKVE